jgi:peptidoglycan hydrolase CwlO-like protein
MNSIKDLMKIHWLSVLLLISVLTTFVIIINQRNEIKSLHYTLSQTQGELRVYRYRIINIENQIDNLESSVSELRSGVDNFGYEDWKYVVPEVEDATDNVEAELEELKSLL